MQKPCKHCSQNFEITDEDLKFYKSVSPVFHGKRYLIPPPTHCPDCREQRRLSICNEMYLYSGASCGLCKRKILSEYPPHLNKTVYCRECWHSDKWDARDYGRDVNFSHSIFEQIRDLKMQIPCLALCSQGTCINSDYIHYAGTSKNCYLIMHADFCEDCYYGYGFKKTVCCVDGFYNLHSELCYDCIDCHKCYGLKNCQDCINCSSGGFLRDCIGCKNCFLCTGLREKNYCFENKQLSKEEYEEKMAKIDTGSFKQYQNLKKRRKELEESHIFKEFQGHNLQNCLGDHLVNCKDAKFCFDCEDVENAKYCYQIVLGGKNIYDIYQFGTNLQESYECSISGEDAYHVLFCDNANMNSSDLYYCWYMETSRNCFACVSMMRNKYCILNKQYTKEEYEELVPRIIKMMREAGEWGEFFPMWMSPFGYNKTTAQLYFPMKKEEVLARGLKWDDYEQPVPDIKKVIDAKNLPDNIKDVKDEILECAIRCEKTGKLFKITTQELKFYRRVKVPLPRRCWEQRHIDRFLQRNPHKFRKSECVKCGKGIFTTYPPFASLRVCCEECYMKGVY